MPVSDEQGVLNALSDYCDLVDRRDVAGILSLFTPDGRYDLGFGRVYAGRERLRELYSRLDAYTATSHHVSNAWIEVIGDTARARTALYAYHLRPDGSEMHLWGQYHDRFVRTGAGWLVRSRAVRAAAEKGGRPEPGRALHFEPLPRH